MPEHDCLPSQVSAAEFLTHMAEVSGLPPTAARPARPTRCGTPACSRSGTAPIGGYSTGMKQRVKLAQALVHDPAFVFLDEPTAGPRPGRARGDARRWSARRIGEFGISVLLSSHLMADVERTCDRIIVLQGGRLVQSGEVGHFTKETETVFIEVDTNRDALVAALRAARRRRDAPMAAGSRSKGPTNRSTTTSGTRWSRPRRRCAGWRRAGAR